MPGLPAGIAVSDTVILFAGVVGLLVLASLIGGVLAWRARGAPNPTVSNLNQRIVAWWWMVAVLGICFWLGAGATVLLFAFASLIALREFVTLTPTRWSDHWALVAAFYVVLPVQYWLIWSDWYGLFAIFIPVYAMLALPVLAAFQGDTDQFLERTTKIQWGVLICVYFISYAPALLLIDLAAPGAATPGHGSERNLMLLFYLLLVVQISDVLQYVCGKLFGRTKLAPKVSPSKTVEGLVGGGLLAIGVGTALHGFTPFTPLQAAGMSAVIVLAGFLGGLALSAVKRSLGAKDWGQMIEGHGGMLDRLDSVCFAAPVFFHLCRYFFSAPAAAGL
ncbi:phosphatidate cytidylyltransferase [Arenimonas composti]|uniref:phosphatidate cytidylyltransferase n=1 Tax=Arenimonas composti TaxID=370776 RepID=UPI001FE0A45F|nr:phosphatidate cytidylyltransferase [Arenimonas composti]